MRKKIIETYASKAQKREIKKRPRMKMHGKSLLTLKTYAGKKIASR